AERIARLAGSTSGPRTLRGPACYPAPEDSFCGYPTVLLLDDDHLELVWGAESLLERLLAMPLTNHSENRRSSDPVILRAVLAAATSPRRISDLDRVLRQHGVGPVPGRATLAWMLKYGLLRVTTCHED